GLVAWKESDARMAAFDVLARLGVDPPDLELLRFGENALYAFRERRLVIRVARPSTEPADVARTVEFVRRGAAPGMAASGAARRPVGAGAAGCDVYRGRDAVDVP